MTRRTLTPREEQAVEAALAMIVPALRAALRRELVTARAERAGRPTPAGR